MTEDLRPPYRIQFDNARDPYAARNALGITSIAGGGGIAPANAQYITAASDATLTAERVATDTATVTWDFATAGQAKANVVAGSFGDVFKAGANVFTSTNTFQGGGTVVQGLSGSSSSLTLSNYQAAAGNSSLTIQHSRGTTLGVHAALAVADPLGQVQFSGSDGAGFGTGARIQAYCEAAPVSSSAHIQSNLRFYTDSGSSLTERMRIDGAGVITLGPVATPYVTVASTGITSTVDTTSPNYPAGAWTAWTPTFTAGTGTITSTTINRARYTQHGKTVTAFLEVLITNAGTGSGQLIATLPVTAAAYNAGACVAFGREAAIAGFVVQGYILSTTTVAIGKYDGDTIIVTGSKATVTMVYEAA